MFKTILKNTRQSVSWDIRFPAHGDVFPTHEAATHILYLLLSFICHTRHSHPLAWEVEVSNQRKSIPQKKCEIRFQAAIWRIKITNLFATSFMLFSCLAYSSGLKIETCSSETSVADFQWTTRRYIPEYGTLHSNRYENLKSYVNATI
jgi:hypothetical protein